MAIKETAHNLNASVWDEIFGDEAWDGNTPCPTLKYVGDWRAYLSSIICLWLLMMFC